MFMFRDPFIITIEKYLSSTYCFAFKFNRAISQYKRRFWFKKKLWLFNERLHFTDIISSKITHFRQCRLHMYIYMCIYECLCSYFYFIFFLYFLQSRRIEKKISRTISLSLSLSLVEYRNITK